MSLTFLFSDEVLNSRVNQNVMTLSLFTLAFKRVVDIQA